MDTSTFGFATCSMGRSKICRSGDYLSRYPHSRVFFFETFATETNLRKDEIPINTPKKGNSPFSVNARIIETFPTLVQSKPGSKNMTAKPGFTLKNSPKIELGL